MKRQRAMYASLGVLFLINILNFYDRNVGGALAEPIKTEFHLTDQEIGLLGSAFIWLYAIIGVPLGRIADKGNRKVLLAGGVTVWCLLTAMNAWASTYSQLVLARLGVAAGEAVVAPVATSWIGDLIPPEKRSKALAIFMLGVPLGGALSYAFSGPIAQEYGWRAAMVLAAAPALLLVPALLFLREPERGGAETLIEADAKGTTMWAVLRIPSLWWIIASGAFLNFNMYAIHVFLPSFLIRVHGLTLAQAGLAAGALLAVGGLLGAFLSANLGDRIIHRKRNGRMVLASAFAALAAPPALLAVLQPAGAFWTAALLMTAAYACCNSYYGFVYSSIQDIVAPQARASTMAIYFMAMYLCGASMGPLLTGALSDWRAKAAADAAGATVINAQHRAIGLQEAMLVIPVLSLFLAAVLYAGSRTIVADMDRRLAEDGRLIAAV